MNAKRFLFILVVVFALLSSTACSAAEPGETPPVPVVVVTVVVEQPSLATEAPTAAPTEAPVVQPTEAPVAKTEAPVIPTEAPVVETEEEKSEAILAPDLAIPSAPVAVTTPDPICKDWNPEVKTTQNLLPGQVARGDVEVNGIPYYDNGVGEATVVINLSQKPITVFAEWGSGCETVTDLRYLISKELVAGCGDPDGDGIVNGCMSVRIVTITDVGISQNFYTEVPK